MFKQKVSTPLTALDLETILTFLNTAFIRTSIIGTNVSCNRFSMRFSPLTLMKWVHITRGVTLLMDFTDITPLFSILNSYRTTVYFSLFLPMFLAFISNYQVLRQSRG
jgi:hypothetical protein